MTRKSLIEAMRREAIVYLDAAADESLHVGARARCSTRGNRLNLLADDLEADTLAGVATVAGQPVHAGR